MKRSNYNLEMVHQSHPEKNQKILGMYDVKMGTLNTKGYYALECYIVFYPYSRKIQGEYYIQPL